MSFQDFALGFILASLLWLGAFGLGVAAILRHRPHPRHHYGRTVLPSVAELPARSFRVAPPPWRHLPRRRL